MKVIVEIPNDALSNHSACPFCHIEQSRIINDRQSVFAFRDKFPVSLGHTLIVPRRHVADITFMDDLESLESFQLMQSIMAELKKDDASIKGFNIGYNVAAAAGQTVMHAHMHIIPRRDGDVVDPVGGIRGVIPDKRRY